MHVAEEDELSTSISTAGTRRAVFFAASCNFISNRYHIGSDY
jgi:hypothetical protein